MDSTVDVSEDGLRGSEGLAQSITINVSFEPALSVDRGVIEGVPPMSPVSMVSAPASACSPPADSPVSGSSSQEIEGSIIVSSAIDESIPSADSERKRKAEETPLNDLITPSLPRLEGRPFKMVVLSIPGRSSSIRDILSVPQRPSLLQYESELPVAQKRKSPTLKYGRYHQSAQMDKPAPYGEPPVWADKRQCLCEALPYYKAYMSGAYQQAGVACGFLVDKEVGPRDKFQEEILITSVGGGRAFDEERGRMIQKADQHTSSIALAFQRAKDEQKPIVVIAGQGNQISPSKLPHYYNVLDWFHITDVWCERSRGFKIWMVRLEKIRLNEKSWWATAGSPPPDPARDISAIKARVSRCNLCNCESKEIFNAGWACLATSCPAFFKFPTDVDDSVLDYNEEFLKERTNFTDPHLGPLAPPLPSTADIDRHGYFGFEKAFKEGIVCPLCHGCSRRVEWGRWTCETIGCSFTHCIRPKTVSIHDAISQSISQVGGWFNPDPEIRVGQKIMGLYDVFEYVIPGLQQDEVVGVIRHFRSSGIINAQPDGPNDLFHQMQEEDFGLKRNPARLKGSTGEMLTSHWAANWGAPYKYGVSVLSKGFDEAPEVIIKALKRLTWAGQQTVTEKLEPFQPFNELLSLGYFEDTSIGYHDDGEKELGPTVATLSLGASAVMCVRPKAKSGLGPESKNAKGTKRDVLRIVLHHGDIVIMHGRGIQKFYEHAVHPRGKLRFALTCRYVRPELMANDEERNQSVIKSKLPQGHERFTYDGDVSAKVPFISSSKTHMEAVQKSMNDVAAWVMAGGVSREMLTNWFTGVISKMGA